MKISAKPPRREKRPNPLSFRLSKETAKQLKALAKATNKTMTEIIEELVSQAHKDTIK